MHWPEKKRCAGRDYHKAKSARDGKQLRKKRRESRAMYNMLRILWELLSMKE